MTAGVDDGTDDQKSGDESSQRPMPWLIAPMVSEGTTIELATTIRADGLTSAAFDVFARLAKHGREANAGTVQCPHFYSCDVFHDHGQTCPQLTYCGVNTYVTQPEVRPES